MQESQNLSKPIRRHDIDWLRVILFALLIWFHYAVFSLGQLDGENSSMELFNLPLFVVISVMHQWRLAALFVISGMGTAFAFRRLSWQQYIRERGTRLGLPLLFGVYILWFGIFEFGEKTILLFTIFPGADDMPYGHLWFIYNLLIYSVLLTPLFTHVRNNPDGLVLRLVRSILRAKWGLGILLLPPLILALNGILFKPWHFGEVGMWWEFPRYMIYFLFGFLLISAREEYFPALDSVRIPVTIITPILAIIWFIMNESSEIPLVMEGGWVDRGYAAFSSTATIASFLQSFHAWFWCLLIFSWSSKLLNKPNKWLSYLNEAVYPTYIVHMHLTFLPIAILGAIGVGYYSGMVIGTIFVMIAVMVCFEIVRRARFARVFFGIKGGSDAIYKLFPYDKIEENSLKIFIEVIFHGVAFVMTIGLLIFLIAAGAIS
ncbi:MAG: hypothetical protein CMA06_02130 [Euryarchaeota archaeon]|nr:hypothetical protein [Euryarchaeota archaeon]